MAFQALGTNLRFEDVPQGEAPSNATVWTSHQYCVMSGWYSLTNSEEIGLKPTTFADKRLRFLDPLSETKAPEEFSKAVSGQYDVKSWRKDNTLLSIDGETAIFMKFPGIDSIVTYTAPARLPTFAKSWKPVVFLVNQNVIAVRLTADTALIITRGDESTSTSACNVTAVDYNKGFICVHPCSGVAIAHGSYAVKSLKKCLVIPPLSRFIGPWDYLIQFYTWGGLVIPKTLKVKKSGGVLGVCGAGAGKADRFGLVFYPPNIFLNLIFVVPSSGSRTLQHGMDFAVTAKKTSDSDIVVYLLIDGQLVTYEYSFDTRINKPEKPRLNVPIKFKVLIDKEEKQKAMEKGATPLWKLAETKELKVPVHTGSPTVDFDYLISEQTVAIFDAQIGQYLTHPQGAKLTDLFTKVLVGKGEEQNAAALTASQNGPQMAPQTATPNASTAVVKSPSAPTSAPVPQPKGPPPAPILPNGLSKRQSTPPSSV